MYFLKPNDTRVISPMSTYFTDHKKTKIISLHTPDIQYSTA